MQLIKLRNYFRDFKILTIIVLYCTLAWLGLQLSFGSTLSIPVWPAAGVSLALLIIMGRENWPGIAIGSLIATIFAYWGNLSLNDNHIIILVSLISIGATLQALVGNYLYKKAIKDNEEPFTKTKHAFSFLFIALTVGVIGAVFTTGALLITNVIPIETAATFGISWWVSNTVGIIVLTPIMLTLSKKPTIKFNREKVLEGFLFLVITVGIISLYRVESLQSTLEKAFPFLVIPMLIWLAFRFSLGTALAVMIVISVFTIERTTQGLGPFFATDTYNSMLLLQSFVGIIGFSTLILSATVKERNIIQNQLEEFNIDLESKVTKRTRDLNEEIQIRTKAEEKLKVSNRKLRKTNTELDNFVYSVSHDLRAPIASTLGLINLAKKDLAPEMMFQYLEMIENSAIQQDKFIKKILDQSRNSRLEIKKEEITFDKLIEEIFSQLRFMDINEKITKNISINQDEVFYSDPWRLKVIFNNLLSNSIRHKNGQPPKIDIDIQVANNEAHISIQDNGKGIPKKHMRHVFKMFYRATDENAGSGLGLYIVKETIDKLNGSIKLNSEEGNGTAVDLIIPSLN